MALPSKKKKKLVLSSSSNGKKNDNKIHDCEDIIGERQEEVTVLADLIFLGVQIH